MAEHLNEAAESKEIHIRFSSSKPKKELKNIAQRHGVTLNNYIKMKLVEIIEKSPAEYRKPFNNE